MAKRKRSKQLSDLAGRVRHCVRYGRSATGRKVCRKYKTGRGAPWRVARGRAGIKRKFVERAYKKRRKGDGRRRKRTCIRFGRNAAGRRVCRKWSVGARRKVRKARRKGLRGAKRTCVRWGTGKKGRRVCRKWRIRGDGRRRRSPLKGRKRRCIRFGTNRRGKRVCRGYAKTRAGAVMLDGFSAPRRRKGKRRSKRR